MKDFSYTITDEAGMHARPAGMLVKAIHGFESEIILTCRGKTANCKKLFAIMSLAVKQGETVTISAEGPDEDAAIKMLQEFMQKEL